MTDLTPEGIDALTGIPGRRSSLNEAARRIAIGEPVHSVVIDIDDFGLINANLGTSGGDDVLVEVASALQELLPGWFLGRISGDQFLAIGDHALSDWQRGAITAVDLGAVNGSSIVQLSAGESSTFISGFDTDALIADTFAAAREAKSLGKQRLVVADTRLCFSVRQRQRLASEARVALENNQLVAWGQPILDLPRDRIAGVELLARWPRTDGTVESPGLFIPIVESLGFSYLLGEFMIRQAIDVLTRLSAAGDDEMFVSVNISARHVAEPLLSSLIAIQLERHGIDPGRLVVELTESQRLPDSKTGRTAIERLRSLGVGVASDDLGAGWSTLTQMLQLQFSHVKTDRELIRATARPGGFELINSIRLMTEGAGRVAIAEGIETEAELAAVRNAGFVLGQGWLLGRPAPLDAVLPLLGSSTAIR